jgi:hypothetical protein
MEWTLAHPLHDVDDIVNMADSVFGHEADGILTRDKAVFRKHVTVATTVQLFDKSKEFIAVCRAPKVIDTFLLLISTGAKLCFEFLDGLEQLL